MCSAIFLRMMDMGSRISSCPAGKVLAAGGAADAGAGFGAAAAGALGAGAAGAETGGGGTAACLAPSM